MIEATEAPHAPPQAVPGARRPHASLSADDHGDVDVWVARLDVKDPPSHLSRLCCTSDELVRARLFGRLRWDGQRIVVTTKG
jgi:hypothetical protein